MTSTDGGRTRAPAGQTGQTTPVGQTGQAPARPTVGDVLAPRAAPAALAWPRPFPVPVRVLLGGVALLFTAAFLYTTITSALVALRDPAVGTASGGGLSDRAQVFSYLLILAAAGLALLAAGGTAGRRGAGFPGGSAPRVGRLLLGAAACVYAPLILCTTVYSVLAATGSVAPPNSPRQSTVVALSAALSSGIAEEVFVVVVPVALVGGLIRLAGQHSPGAARAAVVALAVLMVAARLSYHVYYGSVALVLLPWAVLSVVFYLRTRAVLPLMICHVAYDAILSLPGALGIGTVVLLALAAAAVATLTVHAARLDAAGVR